MRSWMMILAVCVLLPASSVEAGRFRLIPRNRLFVRHTPSHTRIRSKTTTCENGVCKVERSRVLLTGSDQERAEAEAAYMAKHGIKGHVGGCIGSFEGVGWSTSTPNCGTCTPSRRMRLVADAVAKGKDGWYRVRAWR